MNKHFTAKIIAIIASILVIAHLIIFAFYRYDFILFFIGFGILYLTIPLVKWLRKS
ncbi:MAG: hypothetical protein U9R08_04480 [Nanoarchaeota archaeon]|nr:hypothetical protein [Nanoarchaeota archaeon]